jgi:hypothetical protein
MPTDKPQTTIICPICSGNILSEADLEALREFVKEMHEKTIPEIVEAVRRRQELASENRGPLW